ncbi:MAG TPA: hypothetical protein VGK20_16975 [Candidatus Binatia bacterium]|jgi:hypothetical protein
MLPEPTALSRTRVRVSTPLRQLQIFPPALRVALSAALLVALVPARALALSCLEDRIGEPVNCTANDVRITDFHDIVVTDDGCAFAGDTVTFNAVLTVVTTATQRYDIGLFIGEDGRQALTGDCRVRVLPTSPPPFVDLDGDTCGDTTSSATLELPVKNITVNCVDSDGDHNLDVAFCTSWEQNANSTCTGPGDVMAGTPSKCNCPVLPTNIPIFVPEPVCTDATCDDGLFCNGREVCDPTTGCVPGTPPDCDDGVACTTDSCSESLKQCVHQGDNTRCDDGVACTVDTCSASGCSHRPDNSLCDDGKFCDGAETCSPTAGCRSGTPPNCADTIACTIDTCSEANKRCEHTPNDSLCMDTDICTDDHCDPAHGCVHTDNSAPCDDHNVCTANDHCADDECVPGGTVCGDGIVETQCGEICDPGKGEICDNGIDDDGDGLIDCADPDCTNPTSPPCDENCQPIPPCSPILSDPSILYPSIDGSGEALAADGSGGGYFQFHGRFVPAAGIDPMADGFVLTLVNANGEIWRGQVLPGDLRSDPGRNRFWLNSTVASSSASSGGIAALHIRKRQDQGVTDYGIRARAYGDFSRATLAQMTTQVYVGSNVGYVTAMWTRHSDRWTLFQRDLRR